jgi:hypothetical protein
MVDLKHSEMRVIDDALDMHGGYVLDFSDRTFKEFFEDEFGIDIYAEKYRFNGTSKAKHLRAFIKAEDAHTVSIVLRKLWEQRRSIARFRDTVDHTSIMSRFFEVLKRVEDGACRPKTDAIDRFKADTTLEELVAAIERDIQANKPVAALDRLHTYSMKKFAHLLDQRGISWEKDEPLHSRVGKYVKALDQQRPLRDVTKQIAKSSIIVFERYNHVRNNQSFAHDNEVVDEVEARFIYDAISAFLRFIRGVEAAKFGP